MNEANVKTVKLFHAPPPVDSLEKTAKKYGLQSLYVKRDDQLTSEFGGCKIRSLEIQINDALKAGADTILIAARAGSNAVAALSVFAARFGIKVCAILKPQVYSPTAQFNLELMVAANVQIVPVSPTTSLQRTSNTVRREMARLKREKCNPYFIGFGGGNTNAALAQIYGIEETWSQLKELGYDHVDRLYVAGASFATAAGFAAGLAVNNIKTKLVIVGLAHEAPPGENFYKIAKKAARIAQKNKESRKNAPVVIDNPDFYCAFQNAFGEITPPLEVESMQEVANLSLDAVYTRKVFAFMLSEASKSTGSNFMFWHTGNTQQWPAGYLRPHLTQEIKKLLPLT